MLQPPSPLTRQNQRLSTRTLPCLPIPTRLNQRGRSPALSEVLIVSNSLNRLATINRLSRSQAPQSTYPIGSFMRYFAPNLLRKTPLTYSSASFLPNSPAFPLAFSLRTHASFSSRSENNAIRCRKFQFLNFNKRLYSTHSTAGLYSTNSKNFHAAWFAWDASTSRRWLSR